MREQLESMMKSTWTLSLLGMQQTAHFMTSGEWESPAVTKVTEAAKEGLGDMARMALGPGEYASKGIAMAMVAFDTCGCCGEQAKEESEAAPAVRGWGPIPRLVDMECTPMVPTGTTGWGPMP